MVPNFFSSSTDSNRDPTFFAFPSIVLPREQSDVSAKQAPPRKRARNGTVLKVRFDDEATQIIAPGVKRTDEERVLCWYSITEITQVNAHAFYELDLYHKYLQDPSSMRWFHDVYCVRGLLERERREQNRRRHCQNVIKEQKRLRERNVTLDTDILIAKASSKSSRQGIRRAIQLATADAAAVAEINTSGTTSNKARTRPSHTSFFSSVRSVLSNSTNSVNSTTSTKPVSRLGTLSEASSGKPTPE